MYAEERQRSIVDLVATNGRAGVGDLARRLEVTPETIRRDLEVLEDEGLVRRVHGGALPVAPVTTLEPSMDDRELVQSAEKERIATAAEHLLPASGGSVIMDAGTTTGRLVGRLPPDTDLTLVTNSVTNAARLTRHRHLTLHLVGGRVRGATQAAVGPATVEALARLRVDVAFLGTNGLTAAFGASTPDPDESAVKQAMVRAAHRVIVLADATKFGREHLYRVMDAAEVDAVITDDGVDPVEVAALERLGVEVVVAA